MGSSGAADFGAGAALGGPAGFGGVSGGKARRYLNRLHSEEHLSGIALYDAMRMRLAPDLQLLGAVQRPVEARIYGPPSSIESRP